MTDDRSNIQNSPSFPGFFIAKNLLFHRLSQQKVNVIMTFIKSHDDPVYTLNSCFTQIFEWRTKNTLFFYNFSLRLHRIPEFSTFREIPEYSRFSRFVATLHCNSKTLRPTKSSNCRKTVTLQQQTIFTAASCWNMTTRPPRSPVANNSPSRLNSTHDMMSA